MRRSPFSLREQLLYRPTVQNRQHLPRRINHVIIAGMGGSALAGSLLAAARQDLDITVHRDFGLSKLRADRRRALVIVCSHSGETEESLAAYAEARKKGIPVAAIATGGSLIARAERDGVPFISYPDLGMQPRHAVWFQVVSLCVLLGLRKDKAALEKLARVSHARYGAHGKKLARTFLKRILVVYASRANRILAYLWKIAFNENAKSAAFSNVVPELNHNELTAWEHAGVPTSRFAWLLVSDPNDDRRIVKRMDALSTLWKRERRMLARYVLPKGTFWEKAVATFLAAHTCANEIARRTKTDATNVPFIEEFKRLVRR